MILVWDFQTLNRYLSSRAEEVLPTTGETYAILLVKNSRSGCKNPLTKRSLRDVLRRLWYEFGLLNVFLQTPCSCVTEQLIVYNPFTNKNGERGEVKLIHVSDAMNHWVGINNVMNFQQYPLRISMFERPLTAVGRIPSYMRKDRLYNEVHSSGGYGGVDGLFVHEMTKYYHFNAIISHPEDGETFGRLNSNGTLTGSLGELVHQKTDFGGNSRFVMTYDSNHFRFTNPIGTDRICVVVAKADLIPRFVSTHINYKVKLSRVIYRYQMIFRIFSWKCWIAILAVLLIYITMWIFIRSANPSLKPTGRTEKGWYDAAFEIVMIISDQSLNINWSSVQRIFLATCIIFNIIISSRSSKFRYTGVITARCV